MLQVCGKLAIFLAFQMKKQNLKKMPEHYVLRAGNLADMQRQSFEPKDPGSQEVQISVRAIGLNFADVFAIWGLYGAAPKDAFTPGLEYSGIVTFCAPRRTSFHVRAATRCHSVVSDRKDRG
jgi:D-arabinose 1-dehydrogenase-like Zn-dependent alcohol dehydrogenase